MNSGEGEGEKGDACMHTKVMSESVLARMGVNIVHITTTLCTRALATAQRWRWHRRYCATQTRTFIIHPARDWW